MAANNPPSKWYVNTGSWGTDIDRNESVFVSDGASLKWITSTGVMYGDFFWVHDDHVAAPTSLLVWARFQPDSDGDGVSAAMEFYQSDQATLISTVVFSVTQYSTGGVWAVSGALVNVPANARWARIKLSGDADVYLDEVRIERVRPYIEATMTDHTNVVPSQMNGTWTVRTHANIFNTVNLQSHMDTTDDAINIYRPGVYFVEAAVTLDDIVAGDVYAVSVSFYTNAAAGATLIENVVGSAHYFGVTSTQNITIKASGIVVIGYDAFNSLPAVDKVGTAYVSIARTIGTGTPDIASATIKMHQLQ